MPQVQLQQEDFDVQLQMTEKAPTDVFELADRILELV